MAKQKQKMQKKVVVSKKSHLALRDKAVALITKGWTTDRIVAKHPELSRMQVAAYRAHVTMGTYK